MLDNKNLLPRFLNFNCQISNLVPLRNLNKKALRTVESCFLKINILMTQCWGTVSWHDLINLTLLFLSLLESQ